jgi:hypothetical protein
MKGARIILLLFTLAAVALILVLPHVDLPDIAFNEANAPLVVKIPPLTARVVSTGFITAVHPFPFPLLKAIELEPAILPQHENLLLELVCILRC